MGSFKWGFLWSNFARSKYFRGDEPYDNVQSPPPPLGRAINRHYSTLNAHCHWIVGSGDRRFWIDKWVGERIIGPLPVDASLTIAAGLEIISDLWPIIPPHLHPSIRQVVFFLIQPDKLVFTTKEHGGYSTKDYICFLDEAELYGYRLNRFCNHSFLLPYRLSYGSWCDMHCQWMIKLSREAFIWCLDVDVVARPRKSPYIAHLFIQSEKAREVWKFFARIFRIQHILLFKLCKFGRRVFLV